jgi:hypothetical protein
MGANGSQEAVEAVAGDDQGVRNRLKFVLTP